MRSIVLAFLCCLGLAWSGAASAQALGDAGSCPPQGDATKPKLKHLNEEKARLDEVSDDDVDDTVTMEEISEPGDDRLRWQDGQGVEITAYVIEVRDGGAASSNCHSSKSSDHDTVLELVPTQNFTDRAHRIYAVVTPQWRQAVAADRVDWSTQALRAQYVQRWVIIRGWLLFNFEAASTSLHTADLGGPAATRATAWEIHPVTSIDLQEDVLDQQAGPFPLPAGAVHRGEPSTRGRPTSVGNAGQRPGGTPPAVGEPSTEGRPTAVGNAGRRPAVTPTGRRPVVSGQGEGASLRQIEHQHLGVGVACGEPKGRFLGGPETIAGF